MAWIFYASGSIVLFTILFLLQRIIAVDSRHQRAMAVIFNFIAGVFAVIIFLVTGAFRHFQFSRQPVAWVSLLVASLAYALFERYRFKVAKVLDASLYTIIGNISVLVAFIGALLLYSEPLTTNKLIGAILIISSLFLASLNKSSGSQKSLKLHSLLLGVAVFSFLGIGWMLDKMGALYFNADTYNILI
jgi:drug/metabolite transporter (DMT)-like permease